MPLISVIVPIYNVERYLDACLESLACQTWQDIEVVMVDDGSPDAGAAIAERHAARDPRFVLVRRPNGGLGAARNTGLRRARGEFLAFLDGDDMLPLHALETMVTTLMETGSDFVAGNVHRFSGRGVRQSPMHREVFARARRRTRIADDDLLMRDRLVTNKLWRRSFWDGHGFGFPEGVLYEDIVVALRAHFLAEAVDVLPVPVYLWREREGEQLSITQDRAQVKGVEDRFTAVRTVRAFLTEEGFAEHVPVWDRTALDHDLSVFLTALRRGDEAFRRRFAELTAAYLDEAGPGVPAAVSAARRVAWHLVRQGRLDDAAEAVAWERTAEAQAVRRGARYHLDAPVPDLPAAATRLRGDLTLLQRLDEVRWEDGRLVVEGRVTLRYLRPTQRVHQQVFATLVQSGTGRQVRVPVTAIQAGSIGSPRHSRKRRDWGGFRLVVDPAKLDGGRASTWHVELMVLHRGMVRRERLRGNACGAHEAWPGVRVVAEQDDGDFALRVEPERLRLTGRSVEAGRIRLTGTALTGLTAPALELVPGPGGSTLSYPVHGGDGAFHAEIDLADVLPRRVPRLTPGGPEAAALDTRTEWRIRLVDGGRVMPIADDLVPSRHAEGGREIIAGPSPAGELTLRVQPPAAVVERAEWSADGRLLLAGGFTGTGGAPVHLVASCADRHDERLFPVHCDGARFEAEIAPGAVHSLAGTLPLPSGRYRLALRAPDRELPLEACGAVQHRTPVRTFVLEADEAGNALLTVDGDLTEEERGAANQRELRTTHYAGWRREPLRQAVLFDSFSGRQFSGSPRAVYEELRRRGAELEFLWVVRDGQVELPSDVAPVRLQGREHYEALARCRYVVTDTDLPMWFEHREGQAVLQTRRGSPLRRVGFDTGGARRGLPEAHEELIRQTATWDYLISPSPWCTPILKEAFAFGGALLETGSPRNDVLAGPDRWERAARVRERIGVLPGRKTVLYAPAARREAVDGRGRRRFDLRLDLDRMRERLGPDHTVLVRRHPDVVDMALRTGDGFAVDVSAYPDAAELYLAADVLVTDYSSAMADFAVTGRPILLYAYDLEQQREERGFYLDLETEAPGPLLRSTEEVVAALRGLGEVAAEYGPRYADFTARYCALDDGGAAARVVDALFT
ncbi:bifunctional glycosyltransferase/CDP-glycerol:glycerophosphate glycerophosphotransferase [Planobispora takensis]|uniref:Glycosyltransferase 2-like domain-containing protein n=1 Tax=Planobispora takensis TaxID=1367882 RepID=A0A8J3WXW5_9ACTN|nr:bifunctional glycosyltransferase family 2 protein/CDP-glycerol:glycerophosphate glycerophosphotransferase [Planobispora takensis]GII03262.1 hypothetical protein Pta02_52700 [Planobispora takensis]